MEYCKLVFDSLALTSVKPIIRNREVNPF